MKSNNTIGIKIKTFAYPSLLSCVIMRERQEFPTDESIRTIGEPQGENLRFFQRFVEDEEEKSIEFSPLVIPREGGGERKVGHMQAI